MQKVLDLVAAVPGGSLEDIFDCLIQQKNFKPQRSLVFSDDNNAYKILRIKKHVDVDYAVDRVNRYNPGYIKSYNVLSKDFVKLTLRKETGQQLNWKPDKDTAYFVFDRVMNHIENSLPYLNRDYSSNNIFLDGDQVKFVDWDDIFDGRIFSKSDHHVVYSNMPWLHNHMSFASFKDIWNRRFCQ